MISLLIEIALVLGIIVLGCYILDNLVVALIVCFAIYAFLSRKPKKKKEESVEKSNDIPVVEDHCCDCINFAHIPNKDYGMCRLFGNRINPSNEKCDKFL